MALQADALVSLEDMRDFLGEDVESRARIIERYINAATETIHGFTHRKLRSRVWTDLVLDSRGGRRLLVPEYPVTELTKVEFLLSTIPQSWDVRALTEFTVVQPHRQAIDTLWCSWPHGPQVVRLSFTAGLEDVPSDLNVAACAVVKHLMTLPDYQFQQIQSISTGGTTTTFRHDAIPPQVVDTLRRYKRMEF